jgi:hemoglobin-like flavoprotein
VSPGSKISDGTAPCFKKIINFYNIQAETGLAAYQECFFKRLFDVHPTAKPLFPEKAIQSGNFVNKLLEIALNQLKSPSEFRKSLVTIADDHCRRGIQAVEYGIVGEVLFWTFERSLGPDLYTRRLETAWLHIFSSMLKIMVPIAVDFEHRKGRCPRLNSSGTAETQ